MGIPKQGRRFGNHHNEGKIGRTSDPSASVSPSKSQPPLNLQFHHVLAPEIDATTSRAQVYHYSYTQLAGSPSDMKYLVMYMWATCILETAIILSPSGDVFY